MKSTETVAGKGKRDKLRRGAKSKKHEKHDKHPQSGEHSRSTSGKPRHTLVFPQISLDALPASEECAEKIFKGELLELGVGKRSRSSWQPDRDDCLIRPYPPAALFRRAHFAEGPGAGDVGRIHRTQTRQGVWQIGIDQTPDFSRPACARVRVLNVRDGATCELLMSEFLDPYRADGAVVHLERLSRRTGIPHTLILECPVAMFSPIMRWALGHCRHVIIHQALNPAQGRCERTI